MIKLLRGTALENGVPVPTVEPIDEIEHPSELLAFLKEEERRTLDIRMRAMLWAAFQDPRTASEIAAEIGCSKAAISKAAQKIWETAGVKLMLKSAAGRKRMSEAGRERWRKRKAAGGSIPAAIHNLKPSA